MPDAFTLCLTSVEAVALSFFIDRAVSKPCSMISDFLHSDLHFKLVITCHVFLHIAAMVYNSITMIQKCALVVSACGWVMLLAITIHKSRWWHYMGVTVHCSGLFAYGMLRCVEFSTPCVEILILDIGICLVLAFVYGYMSASDSDKAYIPQHALFLIGQTSCVLMVYH